MERGWIKLWRKLLDSQIFQNRALLQIAIWALLRANHREVWVPVRTGRGETVVNLKPGQFIFGRHTAARDLKMAPSSFRYRLELLRKARFLDTQVGTHYSVGTIINWNSYQPDEKKVDKQVDTHWTPNGHRQELKEQKESIFSCEHFSVTNQQHEKYLKAYPNLDLVGEYRKMDAWLEANPTKRKTPKGYPRFINNWLSKAHKDRKAGSSWKDDLPDL